MSFALGSLPLSLRPSSSSPDWAYSDRVWLGRYSAKGGPRLQMALSVVQPRANLASLSPAEAASLGKMLLWWSENPWHSFDSDTEQPPACDLWDDDDWG